MEKISSEHFGRRYLRLLDFKNVKQNKKRIERIFWGGQQLVLRIKPRKV
jgi:hypothetical protein